MATYWRLYITANNGGAVTTTVGVSEIQFYFVDENNDIQLIPLAGGTITGSGNQGSLYSESKAFDDNPDTAWAGAVGVMPCWIQYQFPTSKNINAIKLSITPVGIGTPHLYAPRNFKLQSSENGADYTDVAEFSESGWVNGYDTRLFGFPPITGRIMPFSLRRDMVFGGGYQIIGTAQRLGANARKRIRLHDRRTGLLIREVWSATDGSFAFTYLKNAPESYLVMELDDEANTPWLDPACADRVSAEPMP